MPTRIYDGKRQLQVHNITQRFAVFVVYKLEFNGDAYVQYSRLAISFNCDSWCYVYGYISNQNQSR